MPAWYFKSCDVLLTNSVTVFGSETHRHIDTHTSRLPEWPHPKGFGHWKYVGADFCVKC